jgi:hypothetical protein
MIDPWEDILDPMKSSQYYSYEPLAEFLNFKEVKDIPDPREKLIILHRILNYASTWYLQFSLNKDWKLWCRLEGSTHGSLTNRYDRKFVANGFHLSVVATLNLNLKLLKDMHVPENLLNQQNLMIESQLHRLNAFFLQR